MSSSSEQKKHSCSDCAICMELLQIYLDGEASSEQCNFVKMHIETYKKCLKCYEFEQTLRDTLKQEDLKRRAPIDLLAYVQNICK